MKYASSWAIAKVVVLTAGLLLTVGQASAQDDQNGDAATCNLNTLKGRYLFASSGTALPPTFGLTVPTPSAVNGFHIFNGDGTGTDTVTVRIGTQIFLQDAVVPISYTVNADCTGSYTALVPDGPRFDLFIAPNGNAISVIATNPGNYVSSIDQRVSRR